jgi:hypothetical protein
MTQYLDKMMLPLYKALIQSPTKTINEKLPICITLLGQYLPIKTYLPLISTALKGDFLAEYASSQLGAMKSLGYFLQGTIDAWPTKISFGPIRVFDSLI